jgi:uncharacterized protein (DUF1810 family)
VLASRVELRLLAKHPAKREGRGHGRKMTERLERFHLAQNDSQLGFASALQELQTTGKRGHWIWYIFPQLDGLGMSSQSKRYAIQGRDEASAYLRDPVLGSRLLAATSVVARRLREGMSLEQLMGSGLDALKLVSSLTLFEAVSLTLASAEASPFSDLAREVLEAAQLQGYERCSRTLRLLAL